MTRLNAYLQQYTYEYILNLTLTYVTDAVDKRPGGVIYDAIAPAAKVLADTFIEELYNIINQTFVVTATGEWLDMRGLEQSVIRGQATKALKFGVFTTQDEPPKPANIPVGARFSTIGEKVYTYVILEAADTPGQYKMECEQAGAAGNSYTGAIIPIDFLQPLGTATLTEVIYPGVDTESDDDYRQRILDEGNNNAFGGNVYWYDKNFKEFNGVGDVQVYPTWNGGGTVKVSVIDDNYDPATPAFIEMLGEMIDPENYHGDGIGKADIGHWVTVVAPEKYVVNVAADIVMHAGYTLPQLQDEIEKEISDYLYLLRKQWGVPSPDNTYSANVFTAQIGAAILRVKGVANATNVKTNGTAADKILTQDKTTQQLPMFGTVILSEQ